MEIQATGPVLPVEAPAVKSFILGGSECPHTKFSEVVSVVQVHAPGLSRPYPLIPGDEYKFCVECESGAYIFVERAIDAHPETRSAGPYTKAIILFDDGQSQEIDPGGTVVGLA